MRLPLTVSDIQRELPIDLGEDAERVLAVLSSRPTHPDVIAERAGRAIARVNDALVELATKGHARQQHGAWRS